MNAYLNLKTATKLVLAFGLLAALFLGVMWLSLRAMEQLEQSQRELAEIHVTSLSTLKDIRIDINTARSTLLTATLDRQNGDPAQLRADLTELTRQTEQRLVLLKTLNENRPAIFQILADIERGWQIVRDTRNNGILPLLEAERLNEARALILGEQQQSIDRLRDLGDQATTQIDRVMTDLLAANQQRLTDQRKLVLVTCLIALVLIAALVWLTTRAISRPLGQLTVWANGIARGDLMTEQIREERHDEVGELTLAFYNMGDYLRTLARTAERIAEGDLTVTVTPRSDRDILGNAFHNMVTNLQQLTGELQEGISVLASASQEILASTSQVASSAQETASSISEITTTVEEVKQTAGIASQKAKHVTEAAKRTVQVSQEGRRAVEASIQSMTSIREQMQAVADSIVRLSEQSQAIGDIVASVGDLAEQSNMLGVNASIEAVKAGEQGLGFSVVAQEVKTLAEQSKQATAQVRTILMDIQKAMNKAVMVAEQSDKAVDSGFNQVQTSGKTIRTLAESIDESSGAALQIASSSQQQLVGMDQIAEAMETIKQASQDNVEGTRQSEQAAKNLHELGQRLRDRIARFQT